MTLPTPSLDLAFQIRLDFGEGPRTRFVPAHARFTRGFVGSVAPTM